MTCHMSHEHAAGTIGRDRLCMSVCHQKWLMWCYSGRWGKPANWSSQGHSLSLQPHPLIYMREMKEIYFIVNSVIINVLIKTIWKYTNSISIHIIVTSVKTCQQCGKSFTKYYSLRTHMRTQDWHKCERSLSESEVWIHIWGHIKTHMSSPCSNPEENKHQQPHPIAAQENSLYLLVP